MSKQEQAHEELHACKATAPDESDCRKHAIAIRAMEKRLKLLSKLMWHAIKEEFPGIVNEHSALRENWTLVVTPADPSSARHARRSVKSKPEYP